MTARFEDHHFTSADGRLKLYARIYPGGEPTIVLMHGLTRNSADFEALADHLAGPNRLIVPDQRGRGRSQYDDDPARYTPAVYVDDMRALLHELGTDRVVLIGTSMGGLMAMLMGAAMSDRVAGIVLNDVGPEVDARGLERIRTYVGQMPEAADWNDAAKQVERVNGDAFPDYTAADWAAFARRTMQSAPDGRPMPAYDPEIARGVSAADLTAVPPDLWPLWEALSPLPILIIRGGLSDILSVDTLDRMAQMHPGLRTVTLPNRGHAPMLDEPKAVEAIDAFLADIGASSADRSGPHR